METIEQFVHKGTLEVVIKPGAPKTEVIGEINGLLKIAVKAPPQEGKANKELVRFLKKTLGKNVEIVSGFKSKQKILKVY
jgi:uncharacterized protein (TIGR00251 family)